jgi:hypothetical protein
VLLAPAVAPVAECETEVFAGPADDELDPPVSAWQMAQLKPVAIAVPIPNATAKVPTRPTAASAVATGQWV